MRKLICQIEDSGAVTAAFEGGHISKRELLRLIRAIKLQYNANVRVYRSSIRVQANKNKLEEETEIAKKEGVNKDGERPENTVTRLGQDGTRREGSGREQESDSSDRGDGKTTTTVAKSDNSDGSAKPREVSGAVSNG